MSRKKIYVLLIATCCMIALACFAGCSQPAAEGEAKDPDASEQEQVKDTDAEEQYLPKVLEKADGTLIQLTPNESLDDVAYFKQTGFVPFNTYYLEADERGCSSCHEDMRQLLEDAPYEHPAMIGIDTEWTVDQCLGCHYYTNGYQTIENAFGTMIHAKHRDAADCWNCHDTSTTLDGSDSAMYLWEHVKFDKLRGITDIADTELTGTLTYSQDEITPVDQVFDLNAQYYDFDYLRQENTLNDIPLDEQMLEDWTITISGEVENTMTFSLADLIENGPSETKVIKWHCVMNPVAGHAIAQVEVTGIPVSYLADQAGVKDTAVSLAGVGADGFDYGNGIDLNALEGRTAMLVYEMNGEPLSWKDGYPCVVVYGGIGSSVFVKQVANLDYRGADVPFWKSTLGWSNADGVFINNPNAGIVGLQDGQVVKTGEPLKIKGYADAFINQVVSIEISMDRGKTWKLIDTSDSDVEKLITWEYEFTPTEDSAYCIAVRATSESGDVTSMMVQKMFVAHSDPESLSSVSYAHN